jgi:hypothetical protein
LVFFAGLLIGGLITWLVTHFYYRLTHRDQKTLYNKLSKDIRDAILQDAREKLTVKELNNLINEKALDLVMSSPLPFKACPKCGSENLKGGEYKDVERDDLYYYIKCEDCGWFDWTEG